MAKLRVFRAPDGTEWRVSVSTVGASNAQVLFVHPDARRTRENRYANVIWQGPEAHDVSARVDPIALGHTLDDAAIARLYARSMSMSGLPTIDGVNAETR